MRRWRRPRQRWSRPPRRFALGRLDRMRVEVPIAQDLIGRILNGQRAEISTDADPGNPMVAEVSRISPFLAEGSFSAEAEIDVENPAGRLIPGMFVTVDVLYGQSDSTTIVPVSALYDDVETGRTGVYVAAEPDSLTPLTVSADGTGALSDLAVETRFVPVEVLARGRQTVGITGVRPGAWVVVVGHGLLAEETEEAPKARIRPSSWDRIIALQERQGPELLQEMMEEHRQGVRPESLRSDVGADRSPSTRGT
ncbi:MAG: efflux RND transporter periplasmic adaptor subunit [Gemmatimonadota bacterium]